MSSNYPPPHKRRCDNCARWGRPNPLSLQEQSIALLDLIQGGEELWQLEDLDVIRRLVKSIPDPAQPEPEEEWYSRFGDWLEREMPEGTVIGDPLCWAWKIADYLARAARRPSLKEQALLKLKELQALLLIRALELAEAALADIGDAERESGDDLAWAEARAAQDLPRIRAVLARWGRPVVEPAPVEVRA